MSELSSETATDHDHDHETAEHVHDDALAGNVDIAANETATLAFSDLHGTLDVYTLAQMADDIDNLSTWTGDSVTFAFPTEESDDYIGNSREGTLSGFSQEHADVGRDVFALFGDLIDLEFIDASQDVDADIRFYNSTLGGTAAASPAGTGIAGDSWFYNYDPDTNADRDFDPGSYYYHVLIHELGHVMGLSHTSFVDGETYEDRAGYLQNNAAYSAMSYLTARSAGLDWDTSYSSTPMLADVAALQLLYGANMDTRTGDTVYGFDANVDRIVMDFDAMLETYGEIGAVTIWDAGGIDTLNLSKFAADGFINLNDDTMSSVGGFDLNLGIAGGAIIENAIAGSGNDIIRGNGVANVIEGGLGADVLVGKAGNDTLYGDTKVVLDGEYAHTSAVLAGSDSVQYSVDVQGLGAFTFEAMLSFDVDLASAQWFLDVPGDWTLVYDPNNSGMWFRTDSTWHKIDMDVADFADGALHRISVAYDGEAGVATFYFDGILVTSIQSASVTALDLTSDESVSFTHDGSVADIRIFDGILDDAAILENALTTIDPETAGLVSYVVFDDAGGTDIISDIDVSVAAGVTFEETQVVNFDDRLFGGGGGDILIGGAGADLLHGGGGNDRAYYTESESGVEIDLMTGTGLGGDAEGDTLVSIEVVFGSQFVDSLSGSDTRDVLVGKGGNDVINGQAGDDLVFGSGGRDLLFGGQGDDRVVGGGGNDVIVGGAGADDLFGSQGSDTFVFGADDGADTVKDFKTVEDMIAFTGALTSSDVTLSTHVDGTLIEVGDTAIVLQGVDMANVDTALFQFGYDFA